MSWFSDCKQTNKQVSIISKHVFEQRMKKIPISTLVSKDFEWSNIMIFDKNNN